MVKKNNIQEFELQFKSNYNRLFTLSYNITKNQFASEDIIQDVFLAIWEDDKQAVLEEKALQNYLFRSVYNRSLNFIRDSKKHLNDVDVSNEQLWLIDNEQACNMDFELLKETIFNSLDNLPPKCKTIFILSRIEEKKHREIAEILDISIKTVEKQMSIAIQRINANLLPEIEKLFKIAVLGFIFNIINC